jgi:Lrp/AsnC family transcriptional regulator, leucine-responsive regulatory protein
MFMELLSLDAVDQQLLDQLQRDASLSNQALAALVHTSPPTCLRRVKRLRDAGLIEKQIAVLNTDKLAAVTGHGLAAIVEISLDRQDAQALDAFEQRVALDDAVQQCYRVSPGPDFVLVVHARDMPDYLALAQRLFTSDANVRNVKAFFSLKRSKFGARVPLPKSA